MMSEKRRTALVGWMRKAGVRQWAERDEAREVRVELDALPPSEPVTVPAPPAATDQQRRRIRDVYDDPDLGVPDFPEKPA